MNSNMYNNVVVDTIVDGLTFYNTDTLANWVKIGIDGKDKREIVTRALYDNFAVKPTKTVSIRSTCSYDKIKDLKEYIDQGKQSETKKLLGNLSQCVYIKNNPFVYKNLEIMFNDDRDKDSLSYLKNLTKVPSSKHSPDEVFKWLFTTDGSLVEKTSHEHNQGSMDLHVTVRDLLKATQKKDDKKINNKLKDLRAMVQRY